MLREDFIKKLCCPETKQSLDRAPAEVVEMLQDQQKQGVLKNIGGEIVADFFEDGLIREDEKVFYPIRNDIGILLASEGILIGE